MKSLVLVIICSLNSVLIFSQELEFSDGIYFEKPCPHDTTKHKYSRDNISYKVNSVFIFDYWYTDKDGVKKKFLYTKNESSKENPLNLANYDDKSEEVIGKIKLEVNDITEIVAMGDADYTQTVFSYIYLNGKGISHDTMCDFLKKKKKKIDFACGEESTGIVDNKKNLWMHPPREFTFKILQLNPYPYYHLDESVKTWGWNLETGGFYLDPRWINEKKTITVNYSYKRLPDETIETALGKLKCKVTEGKGTAKLSKGELNTGLKSYYYPPYGFVRLEYTNINDSQLVMQLVEASR